MQGNDAISIRSPKRWDEPMDSSMSESDVAWLRSRSPFAQMDSGSFPRSMPLESILRYDCKLRRCEPGEIVVREGDYGNSAFLVLAGSVQVLVESLNAEQMGRNPEKKISWQEALRRYAKRSMTPEVRRPDQVSVAADASNRLGSVDDRQAIFLQDFDAVLKRNQTTTLGPGELFGEVAAMYRSPRTATVIADSEATLLEIRWQGLRVMRRDKNFSDRLENHYRSHWLKIHLREMPLLRFIPDDVLDKVTETAVLRSFGQLEWNSDYKNTRNLTVTEQLASEPIVVEEGRTPTELLIVRSGFGRMSRQICDFTSDGCLLGQRPCVWSRRNCDQCDARPGYPTATNTTLVARGRVHGYDWNSRRDFRQRCATACPAFRVAPVGTRDPGAVPQGTDRTPPRQTRKEKWWRRYQKQIWRPICRK